MVTYNPTDERVVRETAECAFCHNELQSECEFSHSSAGLVCCSIACAALVEEEAERTALHAVICTNCERPCGNTPAIEFSEDGLPFCSHVCADRYPKPVSSPQVRRVLCSAAVCMFLSAAAALALIIESLSPISHHP